MSRATRSMPWMIASVAAIVAGLALADLALPEPGWRVAVLVTGGLAAAVVWRVHRMPVLFAVAIAAGGVRLAGVRPDDARNPAVDLQMHDAAVDLSILGLFAIALAVILWRRHGSWGLRDLTDMCTVLIGSTLVAWLLVARPLIEEEDVAVELALVSSAYLPISALMVTFAIDMTVGGLRGNRAMQLVVAAAASNLATAMLAMLQWVDVFGGVHPIGVAGYVSAFLLTCAALIHPDAPRALERGTERDHRVSDTATRLSLMATSVIVPVGLIALMSPSSTGDAVVRVAGTLLLVVAVVARLRLAISEHSAAQHRLLRKLNYDELTGLATRTRFVECVDDALEETWRTEQRPTIVQLNLDRFKNINDSLGHYDANRVLVLVAERLVAAAARFGGTVARAGGDDFVIMDASTTSTNDATERAVMIREALSPPISISDSTVFVTASIGVAIAPRNRTVTAEELMRRADIATHRAKADGRNRVSLFDDSMQARLARRMDVEHALHGAIGRQEMRLYYQPIVDIVSGRISGVEALMRWQRSDGTVVPPLDFIPIAEETGVICELGAWALEEALAKLRGWIDDGVVPPTATTSVNVSPRQIADPNFADVVRDILERSGVSPHLLWIEMTESMMLEEPELAQSTLRQIRAMGVRLALDDFGTGFSSLSLLQQFPIQRIKIDRAFVQGLAERANDRSLVRTIIAMGHSMGLDLVAEGVETVYQLEGLRELGCGKAQGYLISRPVPSDAMRSTMVALEELATMPLFGPADAGERVSPGASGERATVPTEWSNGHHGPSSSGLVVGHHRPLGQPRP